MLCSALPSRSLWSSGEHGALHPGSWGGSDVVPPLLSTGGTQDTPGQVLPGGAGETYFNQRNFRGRAEEGVSIPLCLGLCFPRGEVKGLHMLRGPSCTSPGHLTIWAEGTHSRQHWIWSVRDLPRPWEHTDGTSRATRVYGKLWRHKDFACPEGTHPARTRRSLGGHSKGGQGPRLPTQGPPCPLH